MTNNEMPSHHGVKVSPGDRVYPNETMKLLIERASCRNYSDEKIPADVLHVRQRANPDSTVLLGAWAGGTAAKYRNAGMIRRLP